MSPSNFHLKLKKKCLAVPQQRETKAQQLEQRTDTIQSKEKGEKNQERRKRVEWMECINTRTLDRVPTEKSLLQPETPGISIFTPNIWF